METITQLHETLKPYYSTIAIVLTWIGFGLVWWRQRSRWNSKEFLGQVNFSVNDFAETLRMRTLIEVDTEDVWPNKYGVGLLHALARKTTKEKPFIRLKNKDDRDYLHRAVKNTLSELCAEAFIAATMGKPITRAKYLFAITCERYPEMRTIKLRVLVIEENLLREWCGPGGKAEQLPITPFYKTRLRTLQMMYELDQKAQKGEEHELGRVEMAVVA